jgi:hypothetical protein
MNYDALPEGFSLYRVIDLKTAKLQIWLNLASLPIFAALVIPAYIAVPLHVPFVNDLASNSFGRYFARLALFMAAMIAVMLLHELVHGLCFYVAGGKPTYGHKLPFFLYAACENRYICKRHYFVIGLAPLAVLTALLIPVCALVPQSWFWVPYFALVANAGGAVGDIYISLLLTRMPKDILAVDSGAAMQIYSRQGAAS